MMTSNKMTRFGLILSYESQCSFKFVLLANANKQCDIAVKTHFNTVTQRVTVNELEMQGTVVAPLKCANQIDSIGRECLENGEGNFKYKGCLTVCPLSYIDDVMAITLCNNDSITSNSIIQNKANT